VAADSYGVFMSISEERVTTALALRLAEEGASVISVHPPDGQGPFVIPKEAQVRAIERGSYHPDVVALRGSGRETKVLLAECKATEKELSSDLEKFRRLASDRSALQFILFRCQSTIHFPEGLDFDFWRSEPTEHLPIEFILAYPAISDTRREQLIDSFTLTTLGLAIK